MNKHYFITGIENLVDSFILNFLHGKLYKKYDFGDLFNFAPTRISLRRKQFIFYDIAKNLDYIVIEDVPINQLTKTNIENLKRLLNTRRNPLICTREFFKEPEYEETSAIIIFTSHFENPEIFFDCTNLNLINVSCREIQTDIFNKKNYDLSGY